MFKQRDQRIMAELDMEEFKDLQLDSEEIEAFYEAFQLFDENGD